MQRDATRILEVPLALLPARKDKVYNTKGNPERKFKSIQIQKANFW